MRMAAVCGKGKVSVSWDWFGGCGGPSPWSAGTAGVVMAALFDGVALLEGGAVIWWLWRDQMQIQNRIDYSVT